MRWPPVNGPSIPSAQGAYSLQLSTAEPCCITTESHYHCILPILPLTKTRVSLPSYSQRVHLHAVQKRRITTTQRFLQSSKRSLGLRSTTCLFLPSSAALSTSCSFVCPLLATTAGVLVAKEEKQPFKGLGLSLLPRHEYAPFFVVLHSFP